MASGYSLQDLFIKAPIGFKEKFLIINGSSFDASSLQNLKNILNTQNCRIVAPCIECKMQFPFSYKVDALPDEAGCTVFTCVIIGDETFQNSHMAPIGFSIDGGDGLVMNLRDKPLNMENVTCGNSLKYFCYRFFCTRDLNHKYEMLLSVKVDNGAVTVKKIGQTPLPYELGLEASTKNERVLEKICAKEDFRSAERSYFDGLYIGALIYLRRVFEKMIDYLCREDIGKTRPMKEKIQSAKENIDPNLYDCMTQIYGVLSEDVHSKDEDEALEHYNVLKILVDGQLSYMRTEAERNKVRDEAKKAVSQYYKNKKQ